jgi:hypothetical protein
MVRRFADAETISATGAFLVGELERLDSRIYEPIADFTYGRDIDLRNDVTIADEVSSFIQSEYMGGFGGTGAGFLRIEVKSPSLRARIPRPLAFLFL